MKKISVIMPVHNTGMLLNKSIGTLEKQSLKDFEIICVDDASEDSITLQILGLYEKSCPFVKTVYLSNCAGAAEARNKGLDLATGEYVIFLDSDDEFDEFFLEIMYDCAIQYNADICCCGYEKFYEDEWGRHSLGSYFPKEKGRVTEGCFNLDDLGERALTLWGSAPWKLFKRTFVQENELRFQSLPSSNDVYFSCMAAILARRICYTKCDRPLVFYRQNVKNQISANRNPGNLLKAVNWIIEDMRRRGLYADYINKITAFLYNHAVYELRASRDEKQSQNFYHDLRRFAVDHEDDVLLSSPEFLYFKDNLLTQEYGSGWMQLIDDFQTQLEMREDDLTRELKGYQKLVLWGMGKRGEAFQYLCKKKDINLAGIADRKNSNVGDITEYGFRIIDKEEALEIADMIVASNREIYIFLLEEYGNVPCFDLSPYCPY